MNPSAATAIERRSSADRRFYLLAAIGLLLVLLIAADGMRKGLDTIVPDYYRHTASLAIAISEAAHGTSGMVGLTEVANAHCSVDCQVDDDKQMQTGAPKTVTITPLAPNNYVVELVEQNGHVQFLYLAGAKIVCNIDGLTRKAGE